VQERKPCEGAQVRRSERVQGWNRNALAHGCQRGWSNLLAAYKGGRHRRCTVNGEAAMQVQGAAEEARRNLHSIGGMKAQKVQGRKKLNLQWPYVAKDIQEAQHEGSGGCRLWDSNVQSAEEGTE
jgi:hypothetical protein